MNPNQSVEIAGMGALCSLGMNLVQCMDRLFNLPPEPEPPVEFSTNHPSPFPVFSLPEALPPGICNNEQNLNLTAGMAVAASREALKDAGLTPEMLKGKTVGVCMGTTVGAALNNDHFYTRYKAGKSPGMDPIRRFLSSNPARAVSREFHLDGPVQTIVNACVSGADAIGIGAGWIKAGLCDIVIAGGTDELCRVTYNGFISLMITAPGPCRPFDAHRKGLNLGEGAAAMILTSPSQAAALNTSMRSRLIGYGAACDAYHLTAPRPDARGLSSALASALAEENTKVSDIGFINAHGTGTRDNDRMEMTVFKTMLPNVPFLSTKGYTGHTLGAAGALEAVFTVACLNRGKIPASRGFSTPDPDFGLVPVTTARAIHEPSAISQSVAFGGNNTVLIFSQG